MFEDTCYPYKNVNDDDDNDRGRQTDRQTDRERENQMALTELRSTGTEVI